ncbi:MAG: FkbM family methyltransferase [Candidatus Zixiibacteriota bacterium]
MKYTKKLVQACLRLAGYEAIRLEPDILLRKRASSKFEGQEQIHPFRVDQALSSVLRRYCVNCVLDVGANSGQYGNKLRQLGYAGHIISFEPVAEVYAELNAFIANDPKWQSIHTALGRSETTARINVTESRVFSSFLAPNQYARDQFGSSGGVVREETVSVKPLASILPEIASKITDPRYFLKMDTQGYDLEVFAGVGAELTNIVGLQSEVSVVNIYEQMPSMVDSLSVYESAGFELSGLFPVSRDETERVIEFDCIMVRPAALP